MRKRTALLAAAAGAAGLFLLREAWRNQRFATTCYSVVLPQPLPAPVRLLQLSDLHGRLYGDGGEDLVSMARVLSPDLILCTGDIIGEDCKHLAILSRRFEELSHIAPVLFIPGNHELRSERWSEIRSSMRVAGVTVLENEQFDGKLNGIELHVLGLSEGLGFSRLDYLKQATGLYPHRDYTEALTALGRCNGLRLVLSHFPELFAEIGALSYRNYPFDLMLSGHAHGGQIRLGRLAAYAPGQGLLPRDTAGVHGANPSLVVSRGLGNDSPLPRINNRPELVLITVQ